MFLLPSTLRFLSLWMICASCFSSMLSKSYKEMLMQRVVERGNDRGMRSCNAMYHEKYTRINGDPKMVIFLSRGVCGKRPYCL
ncbi:hypothetical protein NC653_027325 [Populus alba x Populus x berolinensis]|uniref:Secreted protein n=1 Tax=Populus alba x Populus x berolinensis TaxID=444605 RepID=A0AAD6Q4N9_9ROSI|nr:hypothetical protein NC653_027325 [Populus alba x Populus x berolinensis]